MRRTRGFTLLKWTVALAMVLGVVALLGVPKMWTSVEPPKPKVARVQILGLKDALDLYKQDNGTFPTTEQGLRALRVKPADAPHWNGPYLPQDVPKDPWGHDWVYKFPGDHGGEPDIISYGVDGKPGGDGNIVSWGRP